MHAEFAGKCFREATIYLLIIEHILVSSFARGLEGTSKQTEFPFQVRNHINVLNVHMPQAVAI